MSLHSDDPTLVAFKLSHQLEQLAEIEKEYKVKLTIFICAQITYPTLKITAVSNDTCLKTNPCLQHINVCAIVRKGT